MTTKISEAAKHAMLAVVQIHAEGFDELSSEQVLFPKYLTPSKWTGSGFFIKTIKGDGYILTNAHVVRNAVHLSIQSMLTSDESFPVDIIGHVETLDPDVALIKIKDHFLENFRKIAGFIPHLELMQKSEVERGMEIKAIGYPLGMEEPNISGGEITNFISGDEDMTERYVTDAAINPGNSGGPSINENGEAIGINTAIVYGANNVGFITPISFCNILLTNLLDKTEARLADLGGHFQKNSAINAKFLGADSNQGLIVRSVVPNSMLDEADVTENDILLKLNNHVIDKHGLIISKDVHHHQTIYDIIRLIPLNSPVQVTYSRMGKIIDKTVYAKCSPTRHLQNLPTINNIQFAEFNGLIVQPLSYSVLEALADVRNIPFENLQSLISEGIDRQLIITHIEMESQASQQGFNEGDIIYCINNIRVKTIEHFVQIINQNTEKQNYNFYLKTKLGFIGNFTHKTPIVIQHPVKMEAEHYDYKSN